MIEDAYFVLDLLLQPGLVHFRRRKLRFSDVWTGQYITFAQARESGDIYAWGLNNYFQLGKYIYCMLLVDK